MRGMWPTDMVNFWHNTIHLCKKTTQPDLYIYVFHIWILFYAPFDYILNMFVHYILCDLVWHAQMNMTRKSHNHKSQSPKACLFVRLERAFNLSSTIIWASSQEILIVLHANNKGAPLRDIVVVAFLIILMNRLNQTQYVVFKSEM